LAIGSLLRRSIFVSLSERIIAACPVLSHFDSSQETDYVLLPAATRDRTSFRQPAVNKSANTLFHNARTSPAALGLLQ
jgi:hypothetical protein